MLKKCFFATSLAVVGIMTAGAQQLMTTTSGTPEPQVVTITALTDNIIKVTNAPVGVDVPESKISMPLSDPFGGSIISEGPTQVLVTPSGVVATLDNVTGAVVISTRTGKSIFDEGVRTLADGKRQLSIVTPGNQSLYGAGERGHKLNMAGDTLVVYNRQNYGYTEGDPRIKQMNITMPLVLSSAGYALLFDDYAAAEMALTNPLVYTTESRYPITYYFINGVNSDFDASLQNLTTELTRLTGRQKLPPLWSMGYITSKYGYKNEAETRDIVKTLKEAGYPLDGVVLDLYWFGKEEDMGILDWDKTNFPDHQKMLADLKEQGINLITVSEPYVLKNGRAIDNYNDLAAKGLFVRDSVGDPGKVTIWVGSGGMFDVSNPDTRQWLSDRYRKLTDEGTTGWWGDLGEPEMHPDTLVHYNGLGAREYHNLYGNDWSSIIYELFDSIYPDTRLMTLMRGGTTGLQKYSVFPWSTDVSRSWGGLQPQVKIMLNSGLSGLGYMSHDVGGFAVDPANPTDPELYVRWLQLGTFSPILRTHSSYMAEPTCYPEYKDIMLPLIKARYQWLPYNYTLAFSNAASGRPLVRPLNFYGNKSGIPDIEDEYLWGRDILVAPVLNQGAIERSVTFPDGKWLDITNPDKIYEGGQTITYPAPLSVLPMFVRAGSIIPMADYEMQNTRDYTTSKYTLNFYPVDGESDGYIFEDDMTTPNTLAEGRYTVLNFNADTTPSLIRIDFTATNGSDSYVSPNPDKELTLVVHNTGKIKKATFNGKKVAVNYNAKTRTATIKLNWNITKLASLELTR